MTKLLVLLSLVLSALLTVGQCTESKSEVIVKEGHRVVAVEYDAVGKTNTRVLITPRERGQEETRDEREVFSNMKKKVTETASSLPVIVQVEEESELQELICDATSKYKHKVASVIQLRTIRRRRLHVMKETLAHEPQYTEHKAKMSKSQNVFEKAKLAVTASLNVTKIGSVVSVIGIAAAYGMCVWVTIVSKYLLTSVLGRHRLVVAQSKVHSVYFKAIFVGILVGLLGHVISRRRKVLTDAVEMWQAVNLLSSIFMVEANASFVEPRAIKAMIERIKVEKEEGRGLDILESHSCEGESLTCGKKVIDKMDEDAVNRRLKKLNERLRRLNAYSSRLNLLNLMSLTWHFVYLSHRLSLTY
ncbi:LOW QUALITY PROTEIN: uncharacterized protein LOC108812537 [Raphanus sativus]|uniref:LOW QUALITY PROTEIN: uncharacterized protein LOC108812537 n=1 Tax=Raphanus sativus TaxID=3726 RepID=A0A9W3BZA7_RAPSA|nr:LOW QUALITY PROTEIN: uncharacterized protein LOC108812537 [Raphanus sativus]